MNYFAEGQLTAIIGSPISKPPYGMPKGVSQGKSAEEMLKKALEYANQGMDDSDCNNHERFADGKYVAYEDMAAHLEMLIKEAKQ